MAVPDFFSVWKKVNIVLLEAVYITTSVMNHFCKLLAFVYTFTCQANLSFLLKSFFFYLTDGL